jgi:hypothetical protein
MMQQPPKDRSVAAALVLTFFFGPLGLLYVSVIGGLVMLVVAIVVFFLTLGFGDIFVWAACMVWGAVAASNQHAAYQAWLIGTAAQRLGPAPQPEQQRPTRPIPPPPVISPPSLSPAQPPTGGPIPGPLPSGNEEPPDGMGTPHATTDPSSTGGSAYTPPPAFPSKDRNRWLSPPFLFLAMAVGALVDAGAGFAMGRGGT